MKLGSKGVAFALLKLVDAKIQESTGILYRGEYTESRQILLKFRKLERRKRNEEVLLAGVWLD